MNHAFLAELFQSAGKYHAAMAHYAAAMRTRSDVESAAQGVVGTSLRYRMAIDRLLEENDGPTLEIVAGRARLERLRRALAHTSRQYNIIKRARRTPTGGHGATW